mmetsp:Transcript_10932/g.26574  ORF Transcript_10932/g.26574 Transcript_10932/m.26574 type:complete len:278 (-) Transcript_10932:47-880(-)
MTFALEDSGIITTVLSPPSWLEPESASTPPSNERGKRPVRVPGTVSLLSPPGTPILTVGASRVAEPCTEKFPMHRMRSRTVGKLPVVTMVPLVSGSVSWLPPWGSPAERTRVLPSLRDAPSKTSDLAPRMWAKISSETGWSAPPILTSPSRNCAPPCIRAPPIDVLLLSTVGMLPVVSTVPEASGKVTTLSIVGSGAERVVRAGPRTAPSKETGKEPATALLMRREASESVALLRMAVSPPVETVQVMSRPPSGRTSMPFITGGSSPTTTVPDAPGI